jgi:hypothetical protein
VHRSGDHLFLDVTLSQVVQALLADQAEEVPCARNLLGLRDRPAGEVRRADVDDLAVLDEHLHRLPDLIERRAPVHVMHLVQVDVIGLQASQRPLPSHARPMLRADRKVSLGQSLMEPYQLGGDHDLVPAAATLREPPADDLLGEPVPFFQPYTMAVSKKLSPASSAESMMACDVGSLVSGPKFMVPRQTRLTERPERPRCV